MNLFNWGRGNYTENHIHILSEKINEYSGELTATLETAISTWGRSLATCKVSGTETLTPSVMEMVGRELAYCGEAVFYIKLIDDQLRLCPATDYEVETDGWGQIKRYNLTIAGTKSGRKITNAKPETILHFAINRNPARHWEGRSPVSCCGITPALLTIIESQLAKSYNASMGRLVITPKIEGKAQSIMEEGIKKTALFLAFGKATRDSNDDWRAVGLAPDLSKSEVIDTLAHSKQAILSAYGLLPSLTGGTTDASSIREGLRYLMLHILQPIVKIIVAEANAKLRTDGDIDISLAPLMAADATGRARALHSATLAARDAGLSGEALATEYEANKLVAGWGG